MKSWKDQDVFEKGSTVIQWIISIVIFCWALFGIIGITYVVGSILFSKWGILGVVIPTLIFAALVYMTIVEERAWEKSDAPWRYNPEMNMVENGRASDQRDKVLAERKQKLTDSRITRSE